MKHFMDISRMKENEGSELTMSKLILFVNSTSFEIKDQIFHHDIGYYMFQKPFLEY